MKNRKAKRRSDALKNRLLKQKRKAVLADVMKSGCGKCGKKILVLDDDSVQEIKELGLADALEKEAARYLNDLGDFGPKYIIFYFCSNCDRIGATIRSRED